MEWKNEGPTVGRVDGPIWSRTSLPLCGTERKVKVIHRSWANTCGKTAHPWSKLWEETLSLEAVNQGTPSRAGAGEPLGGL